MFMIVSNDYIVYTLLWCLFHIYNICFFLYVCVWASFFQTTGSTTAAREPGSSTSSSETCTATLEVFYFHPQNSHITGVFLTFLWGKNCAILKILPWSQTSCLSDMEMAVMAHLQSAVLERSDSLFKVRVHHCRFQGLTHDSHSV